MENTLKVPALSMSVQLVFKILLLWNQFRSSVLRPSNSMKATVSPNVSNSNLIYEIQNKIILNYMCASYFCYIQNVYRMCIRFATWFSDSVLCRGYSLFWVGYRNELIHGSDIFLIYQKRNTSKINFFKKIAVRCVKQNSNQSEYHGITVHFNVHFKFYSNLVW